MLKFARKILCAGPDRDVWSDASLLATRLVFGLSMAFAHGQGKFLHPMVSSDWSRVWDFLHPHFLLGPRVSQNTSAVSSLRLVY